MTDEEGFYDPDLDDDSDGLAEQRRARTAIHLEEKRRRRIEKAFAGQDELIRLVVEANSAPAMRGRAILTLRRAMVPYAEIADHLEMTVAQVKYEHARILGEGVDEEDIKIARANFMSTLEAQIRRSFSKAQADTVLDEEGIERKNYDQIAWHREARNDLALYGQAGGLMKPTEMRIITPESEELQRMARELVTRGGEAIEEADIFELTQVEEDDDES